MRNWLGSGGAKRPAVHRLDLARRFQEDLAEALEFYVSRQKESRGAGDSRFTKKTYWDTKAVRLGLVDPLASNFSPLSSTVFEDVCRLVEEVDPERAGKLRQSFVRYEAYCRTRRSNSRNASLPETMNMAKAKKVTDELLSQQGLCFGDLAKPAAFTAFIEAAVVRVTAKESTRKAWINGNALLLTLSSRFDELDFQNLSGDVARKNYLLYVCMVTASAALRFGDHIASARMEYAAWQLLKGGPLDQSSNILLGILEHFQMDFLGTEDLSATPAWRALLSHQWLPEGVIPLDHIMIDFHVAVVIELVGAKGWPLNKKVHPLGHRTLGSLTVACRHELNKRKKFYQLFVLYYVLCKGYSLSGQPWRAAYCNRRVMVLIEMCRGTVDGAAMVSNFYTTQLGQLGEAVFANTSRQAEDVLNHVEAAAALRIVKLRALLGERKRSAIDDEERVSLDRMFRLMRARLIRAMRQSNGNNFLAKFAKEHGRTPETKILIQLATYPGIDGLDRWLDGVERLGKEALQVTHNNMLSSRRKRFRPSKP